MQAYRAPLREDAYDHIPGCMLPGPHITVGNAMFHNHLMFSSSVRKWIHVSIFLKEAFVAYRGTREGFSGPPPPLRSLGNRSKVPQTADRQERRNLPSRNAWER